MQLEKQVRALLKEKQFYDSTVRAARAQLRNAYCAVLFQDYAGSQAKEVEQALWKSVFYRPIEEFRRRIKMSAMAGEKGKELLKKVKSAFAKFLEDAIGFYKLLALRLQATYGNVGFQLDADDAPELLNAELPPAAAQPQDCRISVYRCCICIGDLARYYEANVSEQPKKDWRVAEKYYRKAMQIFPEGGNSYNQLAVLATYTDNELGAVYHYFRSLAVPLPFLIARENLNLLFEQTRAKHAKLTASQRPGRGGGAREKLPMNLLQQQMCLGFIRLHGMLFTKINLDQFADVLAAVAADLEDFLSRPQVTKDQASRRASWVGELLIQLAAMVLFSVQNISWTPDGHKPGYSDIAARTELRQAALALAYMFIAKVAMAAVAAGNNGQLLTSPLMPCLNILLQWLATHPDVIRVQDPGGTEVASRSAAWSSLAQLVACAAGFAQRMHLSLAADEQAIQREALEEDMQLRAFVPLAEAQVSLLVGRPPPQQPYQERLLSVMASVRAIARHLDSEPDAMPIPAHPAAPAGLAAAMAQFRAAVGQAFKEEVAAPAAPQNGTEAEDDEEVIVYTPGHATSSAQKAASGAAPAATTPADSRLSQDPFSRPSSRPLSPIVGWSGTSGGAWGASAEQPPGYGRLAPAGGAHDGHILSPPPSVLPTASHLLSNGSGGSSSLFGRDMFAAARTHSSASDPRQGGQELGGRGSSLFSSFLESNQQQPQQQQQEGYGAAAAGGRLSQPNNPYGGLSQGSEAAYGGGPAGYGQFPGGLLEESAAAHAMDGPGRSIGAGHQGWPTRPSHSLVRARASPRRASRMPPKEAQWLATLATSHALFQGRIGLRARHAQWLCVAAPLDAFEAG
ncbi:hypothetical protein WJX72_001469 [[Myrmecia] bisecta]|uniref:Protein SMG7 n=1 Tax=[Myrmecia] bisecta TaxID=41462 RepID=A0AAW1QBH4_9CHLO